MIKCASCLVALAGCVAAASAEAPRFMSLQPDLFAAHAALSNAFADFDGDGDLDLSLTDTFPENGRHPLLRNELPESLAGKSLQVAVLDHEGRVTRNGSEVRLYAANGKLLGTRLVPTGGGDG